MTYNEIETKMNEHNLNIFCISKNDNLVICTKKKIQKKIENKLYEIMKLNMNKVKFVKIDKIPITKNKKTNYNKLIELC